MLKYSHFIRICISESDSGYGDSGSLKKKKKWLYINLHITFVSEDIPVLLNYSTLFLAADLPKQCCLFEGQRESCVRVVFLSVCVGGGKGVGMYVCDVCVYTLLHNIDKL